MKTTLPRVRYAHREQAQIVALVTGSARRLGRTIALRLAREGYFTFVHFRSSRREAEAVLRKIKDNGGQGALVRGDLDKPADIAAMVSEIRQRTRRLDVLVNNVGHYKTGPLLKFSPDDFDSILRLNLSSCFRLVQAALPLFPKSGGSIVNIGYAGVENLTGTTHNTAYLISKTGLLILTKSLAQALGHKKIRVNMVSPGILDNSVELPARPAEFVPLARLGKVEDVANAVAFLCCAEAGYVTGVNLDVAGGYHLGMKSLEGDAR